MCSRLSPSSSGYKSQSQRSDVTISPSLSPSPMANVKTSHAQESSQELVSSPEPGGQTVMWAVTSISSVPPGSIIIDPQTNQPYTNADGSIYRFDPDNPPKQFAEESEPSDNVSSSIPSPSSTATTVKAQHSQPQEPPKIVKEPKCENPKRTQVLL